MTDRNSDNGQSGLTGVILAVEQFNRQGGREGQMVELVTKDDAQNPATAQQSSRELVAAKVEESVEITSFYFEPADKGPILAAEPGQYIGMKLILDGEEIVCPWAEIAEKKTSISFEPGIISGLFLCNC